MEHRRFVKLREEPRRLEAAAAWFHQKWGIPQEAYRASMEECLTGQGVPQWYLAVQGERILGGLGVITNDFHPRRDLSPNVCAVYVEEDARTGMMTQEELDEYLEQSEQYATYVTDPPAGYSGSEE